jgi:hypothetical protein
MASSPRNDLTALQRELIAGFFKRERRFFLTGGGALVGYYFHHRTTDDLDFFTHEAIDLEVPTQALRDLARELGGSFEVMTEYAQFRRYRIRRGDESCIVDLVADRAPVVDAKKEQFGDAVVDTKREMAANKISTVIARSQIRDLVDLQALLGSGIALENALDDAAKKDASADPLTLAWVLDQIRIGPEALLPGGADPVALEHFRIDLVAKLKALALTRAARRP